MNIMEKDSFSEKHNGARTSGVGTKADDEIERLQGILKKPTKINVIGEDKCQINFEHNNNGKQ